ncbi:MAG: hypothetical protein PHQ35_05880 [Phycisphaerae bacterium]|nr:hypothetical protein [Phycisphaerae bacterium]MDD5381292.1 hypothetical protein [Phycisphaerae bacterium]
MRKSRWLSWLSNDLLDYLLIILSALFLLGGVVLFIRTFHLYEQAKVRHLTTGPSWWFEKISEAVGLLTLALWSALSSYKDWLRRHLEIVTYAVWMKKVVFALWWAVVFALAMSAVRIFFIFNHYSDKFVFHLVTMLPLSFWLVYELMTLRAERRYYHKQPLCNIVAAGLLERGNEFLNAHDFDKAHDAFLKACETAPEGIFLWCQLAHFCELFRNNTTETDKYMAKAEELISAEKANSDSDKACYFNFLGMILYERGEYEKGLEYMKQSIDLRPNPGRIKSYEEKLSEFKAKQQNTQT